MKRNNLPTPPPAAATSKSSGSIPTARRRQRPSYTGEKSASTAAATVPPVAATEESPTSTLVENFTGEKSSPSPSASAPLNGCDIPCPTDDAFIAAYQRIKGLSPRDKALQAAALAARKTSFSSVRDTLEAVGLSPTKFTMLASIGRNAHFKDPNILSRIPARAGFSTLYPLSRLKDEGWHEAITIGLIGPDMSRTNIEQFCEDKGWRRPRTKKRNSKEVGNPYSLRKGVCA